MSAPAGRILIVGATSGIAVEMARCWATKGYSLCLAARDSKLLESLGSELATRSGQLVELLPFEADESESHQDLLLEAERRMGGLDGVVLAFGVLGDQLQAQSAFPEVRKMFEVNTLASLSVLTHAANLLEQKRNGFLLVLGSVAGDRGRKSNYVYGASKAALEVFVQGLRGRLNQSGVKVILVKPGPVDTKMTQGRKLRGRVLMVAPERVAGHIIRSVERGQEVIYSPWYWAPIMALIRLIPEPIFKRLDL